MPKVLSAVAPAKTVETVKPVTAPQRVAHSRAMKVASPYIDPKTNTVDVAGALMAGVDRGIMATVVGQGVVSSIDERLRAIRGYAINPATGYPYTNKQAQAEGQKAYDKAYASVMAQYEPRLSAAQYDWQRKQILAEAKEAAHIHAAPIRGARRQLLGGYQFPDEKPLKVTPVKVPPGVYEPRTPAQQLESGIPWLGTPPGVIVKSVGGKPVITSAPLAYIPPKGLKFSPEQTKYRAEISKLEKAVIPTLAPKMREAFAEGKRTGDFARYNKLVEESRVEPTPEQERIRAALIKEYGSLQEAIKAAKELTTKEQERIRAALVEEWGSVAEAVVIEKAERERALAQERITGKALAKLSRFKKEVGRIEIGGRVYRGKDVYDLFGILRASKKDEAIEKAAISLFGVRQVAQTKGALTKWENTLKSDFPKLHQVYEKGGLGAYNKEVEKLQAEYETQQAALATLKPFEKSYIKWATDYGFPEEVLTAKVPYLKPEKVPTYDLVASIKAGFEKEVKLLFPPKAIEVAQKIIKEEEKVATREVMRYTGKKYWYYDPAGKPKVITDEERKELIKEKGKTVVESQVALYQPALLLYQDPEWQTLRDRPKSDPERQAYQEKWGQKVADTVAYALLAATPWTGKAIGAVGMRLLPPILGGATRGVTFVATGGLTTKLPLISGIPKIASQVIVGLTKLTVVGVPPVYLTARAIDEKSASDIQANWQAFRALPDADKDKWAKEAGYPGYAKLTDPQKAVTLIHYSAPSKKTLDTWLESIGVGVDKLDEYAGKGKAWLDKNAPMPIAVTARLGGVVFGVVEGLAYTAALPILGASLIDKAPRGEAKAFAGQVATGMAEFFGAIPALVRADPTYQIARLTGLFLLSPKAVIKLGKGLGYTINPAKIKGFGRAISIEFSTLRVPRLGEATKADMLKLSMQIVKQLAEGKLDATARLGNFVVKVRNVPYQIAKPGRYWHFSTDITKFPVGEPIKLGARRLHLSPQAAMRFAITSAYGKPMKHPGLIELVVSKKYQPELYKALGKGEIEIETAIRNRKLDYVSKRTEFSMELGSYPVRQYTLRGDLFPLKARDWNIIYKKVKGRKHTVFDLDGTLVDAKGKLYPGVRTLLLRLKSEGKTLSLWTHATKARATAILAQNKIANVFDNVVTRKDYEATGKLPDAFKDIRKIGGEVLIDNSLVQKAVYKAKGLGKNIIVPDSILKVLEVSPKEKVWIETLVAKEVTLDMMLGWHGRMQRLKQMFAKDPRIKKIETQITQLRAEKPEITDNVKIQRKAIPHPEGRGRLKTRSKVITFNKEGEVYLGLDRSAPSFEFVGGSANPKEVLLQSSKWHDFVKSGRKLDWGEASRSQLIGETTLRMPKLKYVGMYLGKLNDNALSGGRVYRGIAEGVADLKGAWSRYQKPRYGYKTPELKAGIWLAKDGTVKGTPEAIALFKQMGVNPATYDLLAYLKRVEGFNIKNVKLDKGNKWLLKYRDKKFANRIASGERLTPKQLASINKKEISYLQKQKAKIVRGRAPELADYFVAEPNWRAINELIMGRREAVKISKGKITPKAIKAIEQTPELRTPEIIKLIEKQKRGETLTATELRQYQKAVDRAFEKQRQKLRETFDKASEYARRQYPHEYNRAYTYYTRALVAAMGRYRPVMGKREDYARVALTELRSPVATRLEPYKPEIYEPVTPYKIPEPVRIPTKYVAEEKYDYPPPPPYAPPPTPYVPPPTLYVPPPPPPPPYKPPVVPSVPPPKPPPRVPPPLVPPKVEKVDKKLVEVRMAGAVAWRQGMLKRGKKLQPVWYVVYPPYKTKADIKVSVGKLPIGVKKVFPGAKSAFRSIQTITGKPPEKLSIDLGIFDVYIKSPDVVGEPGAIEYRRDPQLKTFMDITMGKVPKKVRRQPKKRVKKSKGDIALVGVRR